MYYMHIWTRPNTNAAAANNESLTHTEETAARLRRRFNVLFQNNFASSSVTASLRMSSSTTSINHVWVLLLSPLPGTTIFIILCWIFPLSLLCTISACLLILDHFLCFLSVCWLIIFIVSPAQVWLTQHPLTHLTPLTWPQTVSVCFAVFLSNNVRAKPPG